MNETLLAQARSGDEQAFRSLVEPHTAELRVHCYRMLGSLQDAEDALQETLLAAWRGISRFEGQASVRTWLYRIATNRCLNALRAASRRPRPAIPRPPFDPPEPSRTGEPSWLEPYPDSLLGGLADTEPGPAARYESRETIELSFIVALQQLPARQRAVLVLRDVVGFSAAQVAQLIDTNEPSVKSALQRARAGIAQHQQAGEPPALPADSTSERQLVQRFADAFESDDVDTLVALLTDDVVLAMPPSPLEYHGPEAVASFLSASAKFRDGRHFRLVPTRANTQPAFGLYVPTLEADGIDPAGLVVLSVRASGIAAITRFLDPSLSEIAPISGK